MRQQRLREKQDPEYVTRRERGKTFEDIEAMMVKPNTGNSPESPAGRPSKTHATGTETPQFLAEEVPPRQHMKRIWTTCLSSVQICQVFTTESEG